MSFDNNFLEEAGGDKPKILSEDQKPHNKIIIDEEKKNNT